MAVKSFLSSLYCYTFNNQREEHSRVSKIEDILGTKLYKFAVGFNKVSPENRPLLKYLCWNKYFTQTDTARLLEDVNKAGLLRKKGNSYYVVGMHLATGDNTFTISRTGREYRNYVKSCAIQAFGVNCMSVRKPILDSMNIPELEDYYTGVSIGDGKYLSKITFSYKDKEVIYNKYVR
jgi:hypothetical protein